MSRPDYWFYIDDDKVIQGPFTDELMQSWYSANYFTAETLVRAAFFEDEKATDPSQFIAIALRNDFLDKAELARVRAQAKPAKEQGEAPQSDGSAAGAMDDAGEVDMPKLVDANLAASHAVRLRAVTSHSYTEEEYQWQYADKHNAAQGPYSCADMREWFAAGFFDSSTRVRPVPLPTAALVGSKRARADDRGSAGAASVVDDTFVCVKDYAHELPFLAPSAGHASVEDGASGAAPAAATHEDWHWFYRSLSGRTYGPFSTRQMQHWVASGWLTFGDVTVRREGERDFVRISAHPSLASLLPPETGRPVTTPAEYWDLQARRGILPGPPPIPAYLPAPSLGALVPPPPPPPPPPSSLPSREPRWVYLDSEGREQGPWTSDSMRQWFERGLLPDSIRVRQVGEEGPFVAIRDYPNCAFASAAAASSAAAAVAAEGAEGASEAVGVEGGDEAAQDSASASLDEADSDGAASIISSSQPS